MDHNSQILSQNRLSSSLLLVVVTFILLFGMAARTPLDSDLFWHLRAGEATLQSGRPLLVDTFSHTRAGQAWINHSWLSEVGLALLYRAGGYLALGAAMALLATLSMVLVYLQCDGPEVIKAFALVLGGVVASVVWVPRPQLLSLVLVGLVGYLIYLYKWRGIDRLWLLPLAFALWSNLHAGYVLGLLQLLALLGGETLNHLLKRDEPEVLTWRRMGRILAWTLLSTLAVLVNPNGLDTWRIPFQTVNVGVLQQFISEWASPDFHDPLQQSLLWLLLGSFAAVGLSKRRLEGTDLLTVAGMAYLALLARRNFGPFALVSVPVLVRHLASVLQENTPVKPASVSVIKTPLWQRAINLAIAGLLGFVVLVKLVIVTHPALVGTYLEQQYPVKATVWLAQHELPGRLLNEYNWGGYLAWAQPAYPVFVDGRTDLFGDEVIGDWMALVQAGEGWQDLLARYTVDLVLLEPGRPLLARLGELGWQKVYQDEQAVIYARPDW